MVHYIGLTKMSKAKYILLSSDVDMKFVQAFELYQIRWSIEVLNKECKSYLRFGTSYSGLNRNNSLPSLYGIECWIALKDY